MLVAGAGLTRFARWSRIGGALQAKPIAMQLLVFCESKALVRANPFAHKKTSFFRNWFC